MADTNWDICFICEVSTKENVQSSTNGYKTLTKSTKLNHLKDLTAKWIEIAAKLNHEPALRLLSSGDVVSNELYYRDKCYATTQCQCSKFTKPEFHKSLSMRDIKCKQIALKKVTFYLKGSEISSPINLYPVMELKTMYSDRFKSTSMHHYNHSTTYAMYPV